MSGEGNTTTPTPRQGATTMDSIRIELDPSDPNWGEMTEEERALFLEFIEEELANRGFEANVWWNTVSTTEVNGVSRETLIEENYPGALEALDAAYSAALSRL